jgi:hypothetical protein
MTTEGQGRLSDPIGLGIPVMISGPWGSPRIYPEMQGILDNPDAAYAKLREMGKGLFGPNGAGLGGLSGLINGSGQGGSTGQGAGGGQPGGNGGQGGQGGGRRNRGGNANAPEISNAKGSAKFWIKDGLLSKYEFKVSGKISFDGNDREVDRATTVEIKDVGTTKVEIPEEAKKKLG